MIEDCFLDCLRNTSCELQIKLLLSQAPLPPCSQFNFREEGQKSIRQKLLSQKLPETKRAQTLAEYLTLHYRNNSNRTFPLWFACWRHKAFSRGILPIRIYSYDDLIRDEWRNMDIVIGSMLTSSRNIDEYTFSVADVKHWASLRRKSARFFVGAICAGDLVGQFALTLISRDEYEELIRGNLREEKLEGVTLNGSGKYWGYISTVSLDKEFRAYGIFPMLFGRFRSILKKSHAEGIQFEGLAANAYTPQGERLCNVIGLKYVVDDLKYGKIYASAG